MSTEEMMKNCTTKFLLPGIGLYWRDLLKYGFISAYIDDVNHSIHYIDSVYILYRPPDPETMELLQKFLLKEQNRYVGFIEDYDYSGGNVVCVYKFPTKFKNEFRLFLEGKYSKFSKEYIDLFPQETKVISEDGIRRSEYSLYYHVFGRTQSIKDYWEEKIGESLPEDAEMWSMPDIKNETLDINNI